VLAPDFAGVLAPLVTLAILVPLLPLLAGLFVPLDEPPAGVGATLEGAVRAVGAHYRRVLVVGTLATAAAVGIAALFVLIWLPLDTVVRYVRYAVADPGEPAATESLLWLVGALVVGVSVGSPRSFRGHRRRLRRPGPRPALRTSLRFARHHPLSLSGYYLLIGTIGVLRSILATVLPRLAGPGADQVAVILVSVPVSGLALTLVAAIQATYYRRTVASAVDARPATEGLPWRRAKSAARCRTLRRWTYRSIDPELPASGRRLPRRHFRERSLSLRVARRYGVTDRNSTYGVRRVHWRPRHEVSTVSHATSLGDCPKCREPIPNYKLLIEYHADRGRECFAECPGCEDVVHPV
jgi:hypothetical protein